MMIKRKTERELNESADLEALSYELGRYGATNETRKAAIAAYNAAQQPEADSGAQSHACTFKEVTTDSGIKQRGVWIDRNGADVLYIHASDVSDMQAENARLRGELDAAHRVIGELVEELPQNAPNRDLAIKALRVMGVSDTDIRGWFEGNIIL